MNRPSFFEGAGFALLAALLGSGLYLILTAAMTTWTVWRLVVAAVSLAYLIYLLTRSGSRIGQVTTVVAWAGITLAAWWMTPSITTFVLIQTLTIWLVRSLYFHSGVLAALADAALCGLALAAGSVALARTGSLAAGLWCYFLVQALFAVIPAGWPLKQAPPQQDRFELAHRNAEAIVRRHFSSL